MLDQMDVESTNRETGEKRKFRFRVRRERGKSSGCVVVIYDLTYAGREDRPSWKRDGQPVITYFCATVADYTPGVGMDLCGGEGAWELDSHARAALAGFAMAHVGDEAELSKWGS